MIITIASAEVTLKYDLVIKTIICFISNSHTKLNARNRKKGIVIINNNRNLSFFLFSKQLKFPIECEKQKHILAEHIITS